MIIGRFRSVLLVLCLLSPAIAASGSDLMPGEVVVQLKAQCKSSVVSERLWSKGKSLLLHTKTYRLAVDPNGDVDAVVTVMNADNRVSKVFPNFITGAAEFQGPVKQWASVFDGNGIRPCFIANPRWLRSILTGQHSYPMGAI